MSLAEVFFLARATGARRDGGGIDANDDDVKDDVNDHDDARDRRVDVGHGIATAPSPDPPKSRDIDQEDFKCSLIHHNLTVSEISVAA